MVDELSDRKNAECTISACTDRNTITPIAINILPEPIFIEQSQAYQIKHQLVRDAPADKTAHQMYLCMQQKKATQGIGMPRSRCISHQAPNVSPAEKVADPKNPSAATQTTDMATDSPFGAQSPVFEGGGQTG